MIPYRIMRLLIKVDKNIEIHLVILLVLHQIQ